ncbi:MAG: PilN domain-containing protein [Candidatus Pacebacteria bacterium]|nr:PilN domain-containing protein [Candidatus Paceibacterota bacterium]
MILGINVLLILLCFSLILYSINIFISGETKAQKILYQEREKEFQTPQMQTLQKNLTTFNLTLSQLDSFYGSQFSATEDLEEISETIPSGIYLTNLSISPPKSGKEKLTECTLAGFSTTREILLKFKENLEGQGRFEAISFPPVSWVKQNDINFTVNFRIK